MESGTNTARKLRLLVIDDSATVRAILCRELAKDERFEVIGYARDGQDGVEKVTALRPDVITLDVEMPAGGTEALLGSDSLGCERLGGNFYRRTAEAAQLRRTA